MKPLDEIIKDLRKALVPHIDELQKFLPALDSTDDAEKKIKVLTYAAVFVRAFCEKRTQGAAVRWLPSNLKDVVVYIANTIQTRGQTPPAVSGRINVEASRFHHQFEENLRALAHCRGPVDYTIQALENVDRHFARESNDVKSIVGHLLPSLIRNFHEIDPAESRARTRIIKDFLEPAVRNAVVYLVSPPENFNLFQTLQDSSDATELLFQFSENAKYADLVDLLLENAHYVHRHTHELRMRQGGDPDVFMRALLSAEAKKIKAAAESLQKVTVYEAFKASFELLQDVVAVPEVDLGAFLVSRNS